MADADLRSRWRNGVSGDPGEQARFLLERVRSGQMTRDELRFQVFVGDNTALLAVDEPIEQIEARLREITPQASDPFIAPIDQAKKLWQWNGQYGLGLTIDDIVALFKPLLSMQWPTERLVVWVLRVILQDKGKILSLQRTFDTWWKIAAAQQVYSTRWNTVRSDPDHLILLEGISYQPDLSWVKVDLKADQGSRLIDVRGRYSAGSEVLAAAALFPEWVREMNGGETPFVCLPAYQIKQSGARSFGLVPNLNYDFDYRKIDLDANNADNADSRWAVPRAAPGVSGA